MLCVLPECVRVDWLAPAVLDDVVAVPVGAVEALLVAAHPQRRVGPQPQRRHGQVRLEPAPAWIDQNGRHSCVNHANSESNRATLT